MRIEPIAARYIPICGLRLFGLGLALAWFLLDQGTKWWILECVMKPPETLRIAPFLNLVLGWNRGVSFGILGGYELPPWVLALFAGTIAAALILWLFREDNRRVTTGLGFFIGGALGNALDRLRHGAVTDFLDFHLGGWHWPAFNMADVGVACGTALLILESFVRQSRSAA